MISLAASVDVGAQVPSLTQIDSLFTYCSGLYGGNQGWDRDTFLNAKLRNPTPRHRDTCLFGGSRRRRAAEICLFEGVLRSFDRDRGRIKGPRSWCDTVTVPSFQSGTVYRNPRGSHRSFPRIPLGRKPAITSYRVLPVLGRISVLLGSCINIS